MPFEFSRASLGAREARVVAVGGGKGGIGKTLLTANLGICFARSGMKVVLVDADLGGSNLHTCLGIEFPGVSLGDFVQRRVERMQDVIVDTGVDGLSLISGAQDFLGSANIKYTQKMRLLRQVCRLDTDLVLMDLGSGTSFNVLDFFLVSDLGLVMMVPEPTSLENSYRFIKSAFYRLLRHREKNQALRRVIEEAMEIRNPREIRTPHDLIRVVSQLDPTRGAQYLQWLREFRPLLVINQVRTAEDRDLGQAVRLACRKYFGIDLDYLGHIAYDDAVWKAVRRRAPLLEVSDVESELGRSFWALAREVGRRLAATPARHRWDIVE